MNEISYKNYLVPMWSHQNKRIQNHLALIQAQDRYQAMLIAIRSHENMDIDGNIIKNDLYTDWQVDMNYKSYYECKNPKEVFTYMNGCVTIEDMKEGEDMAFFNVNWKDYLDDILKVTMPETWSNATYPNNGILTNYMAKTYEKLLSERNVVFSQDYALFNTGLFSKYHEPIYAYQSGDEILFLTGYELGGMGISARPERANYFADPSLLLFDWHYGIDIQYKHILEDEKNRSRLPKFVQESDIAYNILEGIVNKSIRMVMANYRLAIPQYFNDKIQLLLPLYFTNANKPDLALVLTKVNNIYQGHTCLTLDMAYNNARLIAKPEGNWLNTDK